MYLYLLNIDNFSLAPGSLRKKKKSVLHFVYFFHGGSMGGLVLPCPAESTSILFSKLNRIASQQEFPPQTTGNVLHRVVQSGASPNVHRLNVCTLPQRSRPTLTHTHTHTSVQQTAHPSHSCSWTVLQSTAFKCKYNLRYHRKGEINSLGFSFWFCRKVYTSKQNRSSRFKS